MPGGDRTGPMGGGPRTGRAAGYCSGSDMPGYMNPVPGRGFWGAGWGRGRGGGAWGGGRGWRHWFSATGVPGWARFGWGGAPTVAPQWGEPFGGSREEELNAMKDQAKYFEGSLEELRKRIEELEAEQGSK